MAIPHAGPGVPVDLKHQEGDAAGFQSRALVKNNQFEAIRVAIPKGHEVCRSHQVPGPITVYCLDGQITFTVEGTAHTMHAGQWLYLPGGVAHAITGVEDSVILLTMIFV